MRTTTVHPGARFGALTVVGRVGTYVSPGGHRTPVWSAACDCGARTRARADHLRAGYVRSCGNRDAHPQAPRQPYNGVHRRVRAARGRAAADAWGCRSCGAPADEWAYDHGDPAEVETEGGVRYSLDPERYVPLCVSCHRADDAAHRRIADAFDRMRAREARDLARAVLAEVVAEMAAQREDFSR